LFLEKILKSSEGMSTLTTTASILNSFPQVAMSQMSSVIETELPEEHMLREREGI
jgi:hypothetical protein